MFKRNVLAVTLTLAGLCSAQAMAAINGGGGTLAAPLYQTAGVLTAGFANYIAVGSGAGKLAFLNNDPSQFNLAAGTNVHWAGSDSALTATEAGTYKTAHGAAWGPLIEVPSVATSVAIPFNKAGGNLDISVNDLCGVFSGRIANWSGVTGSGRSGPITLVYRAESSGTTELFTRFLNAKCDAAKESGTFNVVTTFGTSFSGTKPTNFVNATGSQGVINAVNAADGTIAYLSPDFAAPTQAGLDDATKVARVAGVSPAPANVSTAVAAVTPPSATTTDLTNPLNWVPVFGTAAGANTAYPTAGYPIIGFTNLVFSQCYADATETANVRAFFSRHYGAALASNNDTAIAANRFIPMSAVWKTAVRNNFVTATSPLSIGNTSVCNAIGRPL